MHVLVVAHRTAATPRLIDAVREKAAAAEDCRFTLLVPRDYWDPDTERAALVIELAVPLLEEAAGSHLEAKVGGDPDAFVAVQHELAEGAYDEVIVSTLPHRVSHWLHRDLPSRVEKLGFPVTLVTAAARHDHAVEPSQQG
jgi:hypothetical protein